MTAVERALTKAIQKLQDTNFELDVQELTRTSATHALVPIIWLVNVLDALAEFVSKDDWLK